MKTKENSGLDGDLPLIISLECSTLKSSLALSAGGRVLGVSSPRRGEGTSRWLTRAIRGLLARRKLTVADLAAVAVASGPGSFTGLRIAFASAKALTLALELRLLLIPTLDILANSEDDQGERADKLAAFLPYVGGEYHFACYHYSSRYACYRRQRGYRAGRVDELVTLARDGARLIGLAREDDLEQVLRAAPGCSAASYPSVRTLARLAWGGYQRGEWADISRAEPLYSAGAKPPNFIPLRTNTTRRRLKAMAGKRA